jgi:type IV pilus assembly protein PilE
MSERYRHPAPRRMAPALGSCPSRGFSLIELMIVLLIASILAAFAYPSYRAQIEKTRRADAQSVLMQAAQFMERVYTESGRYNPDAPLDPECSDAADFDLPFDQSPIEGTAVYYRIALVSLCKTSFVLRAIPNRAGPEAGAGMLQIDDQGRRGRDRNFDNDVSDIGEDHW